MLALLKCLPPSSLTVGVLCTPSRYGRFMPPGSFYTPFSERFDEEGNRRPLPHPETPKFPEDLPPPTGARIADKRPFRFVCQPGKIYWWCSCGQSKEQPFCDGHHNRLHHKWPARDQKNMFKPTKVVFEKKTEVWFCTCKQTGSGPFCDGSHKCDQFRPLSTLGGVGLRSWVWNHLDRRLIFSFRKNKDSKTEDSGSKPDTDHAELIWAEATHDLLKDKLMKPPMNNQLTLKHSQIKRMKKAAFMDTIELYKDHSGAARRGFNEFILAALKQMEEYEVADDIEAYKALLSVLPRGGRLRPASFLHADMGAYKQQQDTVTRLLMQLNAHQVMPDDEVGDTIVDIFGFKSHVMSQYRRLMYWVPKLRHVNPWPTLEKLPDDLEGEDAIRLAQLVAARICPDVNTEFTTVSIENEQNQNSYSNCLVSAQSAMQRALLCAYSSTLNESSSNLVVYLDGPQFVWFRHLQLAYYTLWTDLGRKRLENSKAISRATAQTLASINDPDTWNYRIHGSEKDTFKPLQTVQDTTAKCSTSSLPIPVDPTDEEALLSLRPKKSSLMRGGSTATAERRRALWKGFQPSHKLTHLPEKLTRHEQAEGTILAVGVVAPNPYSLENQKKAYEGTENEAGGAWEMSTIVVPTPAPDRLIRQWLSDLQETSPGFEGATVVLRHNGQQIAREDVKENHRE